MNPTPQRKKGQRDKERLTPTEAAARVAYLLILRGSLSTAEIADEIGYPIRSARRLVASMSRVIPIFYYRRRWHIIFPSDLPHFFPHSR